MQDNDIQRDPKIAADHSTGDNESLITLIVHNTKLFNAMVTDLVAGQGFTLDEWMVLDALHRNDGVAMTQISARTGCYGATLTRAVDKLVAGSLVYREASPTDRRKVVVFISDRGREVHEKVRAALTGVEESASQALATAGLSRQAFAELVGAMATIKVADSAGE